jgi:hypothetical protein
MAGGDLGIRHPDLPGAYLAGIECDGASYHSAATARDRDKVREQVLTGLGWNILRVWSTDWWYDAAGCSERLHGALDALLQASRESSAEPVVTAHWDLGHEVEHTEEIREDGAAAVVADEPPPAGVVETELVSADMPQVTSTSITEASTSPVNVADDLYRIADLSGFPVDPDRFHDFAYRDTLRAMVAAVIEAEGPLRTDILYQRIARAHGWLRTGGKIRERIEMHLREYVRKQESSGEFIWRAGDLSDTRAYRAPANEHARRAIPDIPLAELAAVVRAKPDLLQEPDPARELARLLGVERLAAGSRTRLDEAIACFRDDAAPVELIIPGGE